MTESVQRRRRLTDAMVAALPSRATSYFRADPELPKHGIRVHPHRPGAYTVITRDPFGKQRWTRIGSIAEMTITEARDIAREVIRRVEKGESAFAPVPAPPASVAFVAQDWLKRHVYKNKLRTAGELERVVTKYILPRIGDRAFVEIRRTDIARLLDAVEDNHGAATADAVLSALRSMCVWHQTRDDSYEPPFVERMHRTALQDRKRSRALTDAEIRAVWQQAGKAGSYGALIKLLLLTAQRRAKILKMRWSDINLHTGIWTIHTEAREKSNAGTLRLPEAALQIIRAQPRVIGNDYVFAGGRGAKVFRLSKLKIDFDAACGVTGWRLHDCRRTARSLMSRAKVDSEIAEMVLGHSLGEIRTTYDVHEYLEEKSHALRELAALLDRIVNPPTDNVRALRS
jgi:integrase